MTFPRLLTAICLAWCVLSLCDDARVGAEEPVAIARASVATTGELWQGQRIILAVELWTPGMFDSAPVFDLPKVDKVILVAPEGSPIVGSQTEHDQTYTTQRHELSVYPQRAGTIEIPGFTVRFRSSAFGKPAVAREVKTPVLTLEVKKPAGFDGAVSVISTNRLIVQETWSPALDSKPVEEGAAFVRTVTIEADNIPGMLLPDFHVDPPQGISRYSQPAQINDTSNRGELIGRRVESDTFVCSQPGTYELPAMTFQWWNTHDKDVKHIELPSHSIVVTPAVQIDKAAEAASSLQTRRWQKLMAFGVWALLMIGGYLAFHGPLSSWILAREQRYERSEPAAFAQLERACHHNDPQQVYDRFVNWAERFSMGKSRFDLDQFFAEANDPRLVAGWNHVTNALYGRPSTGVKADTMTAFLQSTRAARDRMRQRREKEISHGQMLPPLNPTR